MKSAHVVLAYPKLIPPRQQKKAEKPLPPLPLLSIGTVLKRHDHDVTIIDGRIEDDYTSALQSLPGQPLCIGISCMLGYQIHDAIEIASICRKLYPQAPIIWGGWFPTILPEPTISSAYADIIVKGFGENAMLEIVTQLMSGKKLDSIAGISYRENGSIVNTPTRQLEDINDFPSTDYDLINTERYSIANGSINYSSSRGCPHRCGFCSIRGVFNFKWLPLSPERVISDIHTLAARYSLRSLAFVDDNFFVNGQRTTRIAEGFLEKSIALNWSADMRIDYVPKMERPFLQLLKKSGCGKIFFGAESGSQRTLNNISKEIKRGQILDAAEKISSERIQSLFSFIAGLPGDTMDDFVDTLHLMQQLRKISGYVHTLLCYYTPIPGSPLYIKEKDEGKLRSYTTLEEWADYIPEDVFSPWQFKNDKHSYSKSSPDRKKMRLMSFYDHLCNASHIHLAHGGLGAATKMINQIAGMTSNMRVASNFYFLPFEYWIATIAKR